MEVITTINEFVNKKGYKENQKCEGIIFYGSRSTGFDTEESDIDLQIVFGNENVELTRGMQTINNYRIEYFEKTLGDLYGRIPRDFTNQSNVMLSMFGHSVTIFDRRGELEKLKEYVRNFYNQPLPSLDDIDFNEQVAIIHNRLLDLKKLCLRNDPYFERLFHLTIEKIRNFYYKSKGFPEISTSKVLDLYHNPAYTKQIFKTMPPEEFIRLFEDSLNPNKTFIEKYAIAESMFDYAKGTNTLNPNDFLIPIKMRNKPLNSI